MDEGEKREERDGRSDGRMREEREREGKGRGGGGEERTKRNTM